MSCSDFEHVKIKGLMTPSCCWGFPFRHLCPRGPWTRFLRSNLLIWRTFNVNKNALLLIFASMERNDWLKCVWSVIVMFVENTTQQRILVFYTDFILSIEKASKLWLQICGLSRGGLSSAVSWSADSLHACWVGGAELWSSWVSDPGACTSYPERNEINFE